MEIFSKAKINFFRLSIEDKIDIYYDYFFKDFLGKDIHLISSYESQIKILMFEILDSLKFNSIMHEMRSDNPLYLDLRKLNSNLGNLTGIWGIDWAWIFHHIELDYSNVSLANALLDLNKIRVYKSLPKKYYSKYNKLYLLNTDTREPLIFNVKELISNGHDLKSRKLRNIPAVGIQLFKGYSNEYWDMAKLTIVPSGMTWSKEAKQFRYLAPEKIIERKSKIKITIGDETFYV